MTHVPGWHEIPDPEAEMGHLAAKRLGHPEPPAVTTIRVRAGSAPMSLHFDDADPVAECHVAGCKWHGHGDSVNDAVHAWTSHLAEKHRGDWD